MWCLHHLSCSLISTSVMRSMTKKRLTKRPRYLLKVFMFVLSLIKYYNRIHKSRYHLQKGILLPCSSPWRQLMDCRDIWLLQPITYVFWLLSSTFHCLYLVLYGLLKLFHLKWLHSLKLLHLLLWHLLLHHNHNGETMISMLTCHICLKTVV